MKKVPFADNLISLITLSIRLIIGIKLLSVSRRTQRKNLQTLAIVFFLNSIALAFMLDFINSIFLFYVLIDIAMLFHLIFTVQTFYTNVKSPIKIIFPISAILGIINAITIGVYSLDVTLTDMFLIGKVFFALEHYVVWGWFLLVAYSSYKQIAQDILVEDWVKTRYKLMIYYSFLILIPATLLIFSTSQIDIYVLTAAFIAMISWILQFIVWVMPEKIRLYLNRNYVSPIKDEEIPQTEEELMKAFME